MDAVLEVGLVNALLVTVLALVAGAVTRLWRRPALAHALWLLVLLKLVTPPLVPVTLPWPAADPAEVPQAAAPVADWPGPAWANEVPFPPQPVSRAGELSAAAWPSWQSTLAGLWLTGSCLWWSLAAVRVCRFGRLLRCARPAPAAVGSRAEEVAGRLQLARCPGVWLVPATLPPLLWALLGQPRVLLPEALWAELTPAQQDTLLAHELAHLRRRDHWVRWLEVLALGLFWWHPVAWWARRELQKAEEQLCDAQVVRALPDSATAYAEALVRTVAFLSRPRPALPTAASGMGQVHELKRRLTMIVRRTPAESLPRALAWALLALGAAVLALRPGWAQGEASESEPAAVQTVADPAQVPIKPTVPPTSAGDRRRRAEVAASSGSGPKRPAPAAAGPAPVAQVPGVQADKGQVELLKAQLAFRYAELQQAQADLAVQEARVRAREAQVREAQYRLLLERNQVMPAQDRLRPGSPTSPPSADPNRLVVPPPPAGPGANERLRQLERKLEGLLHEVESLRMQMQREGADRPGRAPSPPPQGRATEAPHIPNAPKIACKGVITRLEAKDKTLVVISIGSDAGLAKGQTLEAYRLHPRPMYLGTLRIEDVRPGSAVAKRIRTPAGQPPLQVGDLVAGELLPGE